MRDDSRGSASSSGTEGRRATNLAPPLGAFVGRAALLATLEARFAAGERLLTLLGPPGMGKSRAAMRHAELGGARYLSGGGVWWCDLTEAHDTTDLCAAVVRALGPRGSRSVTGLEGSERVERIGAWLARAGPLLLVLDNFDGLVTHEPAPRGRSGVSADPARAVEQWCAVAPDLAVLVTSRERLGVSGEVVLELAPLELPRSGERDRDALTRTEAAVLFEARAVAAGGWDLGRASAEEVGALLRALDGIPLAIELAAAQARILPPADLLARLGRGEGAWITSHALPKVAQGMVSPRGRSARHASLQAAIDTSWTSLAPAEQVALARASIFAGDFSMEAAEAVLDLGGTGLEVLGSLRDKSLLVVSSRHVGREARLSLYLSVREYAAEKLAATHDEEAIAALAARYRRHYVDATRPPVETFARLGDAASRAALGVEKENLLAVQRALRSIAHPSLEESRDLARVTLHLAPVIEAERSSDDVFEMLDAGIAAAEAASSEGRSDAHELVLGRLLVARGSAHGVRGDAHRCLADMERARAVAVQAGDRRLEAEALALTGVRYRQQGRFEEAWAAGSAAAELLRDAGEPRIEGANLAVMGLLLFELGRAEESRASNLRARAIFRAAGDRWSEGLAMANLAQVDQAAGDFEHAELAYDGAIERFREVGDGRYEGRYLGYRAGLDHERGSLEAARAGYASALDLLVAYDMRHGEGLFRACLGALEASEGHARESMEELERAADRLLPIEGPAFHAALAVHRGHLDLLLARQARARGDEARAVVLEEAARARARPAPPLAASSEDVRFALRLLERSLAVRASSPPASPRPRATLRVGPEARWFEVGDAARVDLSRRGAVRLLLLALVERRLSAATSGSTTWEELLSLGWPGERVLASAGATRVRVAIATLRRLGLAGLLVTRDDGYLLDPRVPVVRDAV